MQAQAMAALLGLDASSAHRRLQTAIDAGYVENRQSERRRPGMYYTTDMAQKALNAILPTVEALAAALRT
jgi:DNA-binding IclR family transcriptional regulator